MKKRLVLLIGSLLLTLLITTGTYAYTFGTSSTTLEVTASVGEMFTSEPAPALDQPDWESVLPITEYDTEFLLPNAPGDQTNIPYQYPLDGEHWDKVDDLPSDEWETYLSTLDVSQAKRDLYHLTNHVEGEGIIHSVVVYFRFAGHSADGVDYEGIANAAIKTNGTVYEGSDETTVGQTFVTRSYQWENNPKTHSAWTWEEIDGLQAGVKLKGDHKTRPAYCTQVYVVVNYEIPPIIEGDVPAGDLFEITPHPDYTGDFLVNVYLTNTGFLKKAFQHLNIKVYLAGSLEAGKTPDYQVLSLENGVASFNIEGGTLPSYTVQVTGGGYWLVSGDPYEWGEGWTVTPDFYCEVSQR